MKIIEEYIKVNHFGRFMDMSFEIIQPGEVKYLMTPQKKQEALPGMTHGGALAGLMDGILGVAALSAVHEEGKLVATIEFKINYFKPAQTGQLLTGIGKVIQKGNRILVCEGTIYCDNIAIAKATGTFNAYSKVI